MKKVLNKKFFDRSAVIVAEELLGKYLVRKIGSKEIPLMIMETEAYEGPKDRASHASRGKTERNQIMFGEAGRFYIYFVYGMHHMINIVTGKAEYPAAVLLRGAGEIFGPAKLSKFLKIGKEMNGKIARKKTDFWFEDRGEKIDKKKIKRTPRVGVQYAGRVWSNKKYRFVLLEK